MERLNISFPDETRKQLDALARVEKYAGNRSEIVRVAVDRLFRFHFHPESEANDTVLEHVWRHLRGALGYIEGEQMRRAELEDNAKESDDGKS